MREDVRKILANTFRIKSDDINLETNIQDIDTWDSLTHMELVANLEKDLDIEFDGDEIADMISVSAIEKIVNGKKG